MKKRLLTLLLAASFGLGLPSCIVRTSPAPAHRHKHVHKKKRHRVKKHKRCRPSHYWDGHRCRHKGKGKGARKHDY